MIDGINLLHFLKNFLISCSPLRPLSFLIFFLFISLHSFTYSPEKTYKSSQLWTITALRNCVVTRAHLPKSQSFFKNGRCILYGQSLHSNVAMRLKPFFTVPTCWRIIWGRERWRLGCHASNEAALFQQHPCHSCLNLPLLEIW